LQMPNIHRLLFLSAEEVEMLEPIVRDGRSLREILREKEMDDDYKHGSMKNFLYARYQDVRNISAELQATFERAVEPAKAYIQTENN